MALGDTYNNNNNNERFQPTVYCPIKFKNSESEKDPSELSFSYWKNLLKIAISPMITTDTNTPYPTYDYKNQGVVHLTHDKARLLYSEIVEFLKDPDAYNNMGVPSGSTGLISISNGKEFGVNSPILVIRKINQETVCLESSYMYQFKTNYTSVRNFDENNQKFDTFNYEQFEIYAFMDILKSFYESMSYAVAYSFINANQYNDSRYNTKLDLLMDKAGIERKQKASSGGSGSSFFSMNAGNNNAATDSIQNSKHEQTTIEELENMIG